MNSGMGVGLLWLMDPTKTLEDNVRIIRQIHLEKFGYDAVYVHANVKDLPNQIEVDGLPVVAETGTLEKHLFIGVTVERKARMEVAAK